MRWSIKFTLQKTASESTCKRTNTYFLRPVRVPMVCVSFHTFPNEVDSGYYTSDFSRKRGAGLLYANSPAHNLEANFK